MKLTTAEAIAILTKHLGVKVEIVDHQTNDDDWIINTKTYPGYPCSLCGDDKIEIVTESGEPETGLASDWHVLWDTTNGCHIAKYRKVN